MAEKKRSVGLVVLTDLPERGRVAALQVRGEWNFEKMKPESWPGACQVTVHGKVEECDKNWEDALFREASEEMEGGVSSAVYLARGNNYLRPISQEIEAGEEVRTYALLLNPKDFESVRLHVSSGGIRFVTEEQARQVWNIHQFKKNEGVPRDITAMFPDEMVAVLKAFEHFRATPAEA